MSEATFTFRVDGVLKNRFTSVAKSRDRTGAQLLRDFMRDFVRKQQEATEHDTWFRRQVPVGIDAADAGDLIAAEEVEVEAAAWRAGIRQQPVQAEPNSTLRQLRTREAGLDRPGEGGSESDSRVHRAEQPARRARPR